MNHPPAQSRKQYFLSHVKPSHPSDDPECPICRDAWSPHTHTVIRTICGHVFHGSCLDRWLHDEAFPNTCSICRAVCFLQPPAQETVVQSVGLNIDHEFDSGLGVDSSYVIKTVFDLMATTIEGMLGPLTGTEDIRRQFGIDLEDSNDPLRFIQAMSNVVSAGVSLGRFPPNLQEGWMPTLRPYLGDLQTIKFLLASILISAQWRLMTPLQWASVLAERNRIGRAASGSADFGPFRDSWVEYINDRYNAEYGVLIDTYFLGAGIVCWKETNTTGQIVNEDELDLTMIDSTMTTNINVPGTDFSPGPLLYFQGNSLWVSERVMGNIVELSIDRTSRTVYMRSSANREFRVEFRRDGIREDACLPPATANMRKRRGGLFSI